MTIEDLHVLAGGLEMSVSELLAAAASGWRG
jgi:hypothetical protein